MVDVAPTRANEFIEQQLDERLVALGRAFDADAICIVSDLIDGLDDLIRAAVEGLRQRKEARARPDARLAVVLTTDGGYIETVQRIVETLRHHYDHVSFIIPNHAFSAGTVLAMSGDEIWMDYYSRLGPIDPQVPTPKGRRVPALGYLKQWERLLKKANRGRLTPVEAALMIDGFDQAELYKYEQAAQLSVTLLKEWLVTYKFKDWTHTQDRGLTVTPAMRKRRAVEIARALNNTDRWHSHGYGISMAVLRDELRLIIDDLDSDQDKCVAEKRYYDLLSDYMLRIGVSGMIHTEGRFVPIVAA